MSIRAVIFDVYQTLLQVGPPPPDAPARWELLWEETFADPARLTLAEFDTDTRILIALENAAASTRGVQHPEVNWTSIARQVLPELARVPDAKADDFLFAHAQLVRTVTLLPGVADLLSALRTAMLPLGIASNSQAYTLRELDASLAVHSLTRAVFDSDLCFWSFERGFSKPDIAVFHWMMIRLQKYRISPADAIMVGDREDNDIRPAQDMGFQTWWLTAENVRDENSGPWASFGKFLVGHVAED